MLAPNTTNTTDFRVAHTDTNGPSSVPVGYTVSGGGCAFAQVGPFAMARGETRSIPVTSTAAGTCAINLLVFDGHQGSPASLTFTVGGGNTPGGPVAGCPAPAAGTKMRTLEFDEAPGQLRLASGQIAAFPVRNAPEGGYPVVKFTQGQQPSTPANPITEFSVSRCPGVIDTSIAQCYYRQDQGQVNQNEISIRTLRGSWANESAYYAAGKTGCWAASSDSNGQPVPYYVNVRWTYATCPFGEGNCGFSMQWVRGGNE